MLPVAWKLPAAMTGRCICICGTYVCCCAGNAGCVGCCTGAGICICTCGREIGVPGGGGMYAGGAALAKRSYWYGYTSGADCERLCIVGRADMAGAAAARCVSCEARDKKGVRVW